MLKNRFMTLNTSVIKKNSHNSMTSVTTLGY